MPYSHLTNAVISDADAVMLEKPVDVRDGDDLINLSVDITEDETESEDTLGTKVNIDTTEVESEGDDESSAEEGEGTDSDDDSTDSEGEAEMVLPDYQKADPKDMTEAAALMVEAEAGQQDLAAKAIEAGLTQEEFDAAKAEYEEHGKFSEKSYESLAKAGYSKSFIDSYMAGQAAVAERFVKTIYAHVGGESNFELISKHLADNKPEMALAFDSAVERNDVVTMRTLLDVAAAELKGTPASKAPKRNLAAAAKPVKPEGNSKAGEEVKGFTNRQEMVKAMSDVRYQKDAVYRREVELKVLNATF